MIWIKPTHDNLNKLYRSGIRYVWFVSGSCVELGWLVEGKKKPNAEKKLRVETDDECFEVEDMWAIAACNFPNLPDKNNIF